LIVRQLSVGTMANFVYVVADEESREALVVDSGWETGPIEAAVREMNAQVKFIAATHQHFDHVTTIEVLKSKVGGRVAAHVSSPVACDLRVRGGDVLELGRRTVKVIHTPGHTRDSICLYDGVNLFTGDTLFVGTIGRFDREEAGAMFRSLRGLVETLPGSTVVYPGHDYGDVPASSLDDQKAGNPYLQVRDLETFLSLFS
jgi:hydroxyacylglutathione hydrolase